MELILHTIEQFFEGEAEIISRLMENYKFTLHLRKPQASCGECRAILKAIPEEYHPRIMLHGSYELAREFKLKGLHFATRKRALSWQMKDIFKTTSVHSLDELLILGREYNYVFLGPVFHSISKKGYYSKLAHHVITDFLTNHKTCSTMAIGGVTPDKLDKVREMGFDGAALLGAIWGENPSNAQQVEENFKNAYECLCQGHTV